SLHIYGIKPEKEVTKPVVTEDFEREISEEENLLKGKMNSEIEEENQEAEISDSEEKSSIETMRQDKDVEVQSEDAEKERTLKLVKDHREAKLEEIEQTEVMDEEIVEEKT